MYSCPSPNNLRKAAVWTLNNAPLMPFPWRQRIFISLKWTQTDVFRCWSRKEITVLRELRSPRSYSFIVTHEDFNSLAQTAQSSRSLGTFTPDSRQLQPAFIIRDEGSQKCQPTFTQFRSLSMHHASYLRVLLMAFGGLSTPWQWLRHK